MKAMLLNTTGPIEKSPLVWTDLPDPSPGAGEIRLKVCCCAVCRTDLHIIEADLKTPSFPIVPGHQIVGTVDAVGPGCKRFSLGARVGAAWLRHTCGVCRFCQSKRENLCPNSQYTGFNANGGYAEYALVPEDFAYTLPEQYDDVHAAPLLCAGIIGYRALKRANLRPGGKLAIYGFGSSAHIIMQLVVRRGHEVYVVSRDEKHEKLAREMGAAWIGDDPSKMPGLADSAIGFAPVGSIVPPALAALERGGVLSLAGIHMTPIPSLDYDKYLYGERDIHPVMANTRQDGRELLEEAGKAGVRPRIMQYPLKDANRALADLKADRVTGTAVLMVG